MLVSGVVGSVKLDMGKVPLFNGIVPLGKVPLGKVPLGKVPLGKVPLGNALFQANPTPSKETLTKMYDAIPELKEKVDRMWKREANK